VTKKDERKMKMVQRTTKSEIKRVEVPSIESIIDQKKTHIIEKITASIPTTPTAAQEEMVTKLLEGKTEKEVILGLLTIAYGKQLDASGYKEIKST